MPRMRAASSRLGQRSSNKPDVLGFELFEAYGQPNFDRGSGSAARSGRNGDAARKVAQADLRTGGEDDGAFDRIAKLAQVSRPAYARAMLDGPRA